MRLADYPLGQLAFLAGLDAMGNVIKSSTPPYHEHEEGGPYAPLNHNHDTAYSALAHNHDTAYSALAHNHDDAYVRRVERVRIMGISWAGGQTLPYSVLCSPEALEYPYPPNLWGVIMRSDGYLYWFRVNSGEFFSVPLHVRYANNIVTQILDGSTYLVVPAGATVLNVGNASYEGFVIG